METRTKLNILEVCFAVFVVVGLATVVVFIMVIPQQEEIHHLQVSINNKTNVSADYRQGWNDCINELQHYRERATNTTAVK